MLSILINASENSGWACKKKKKKIRKSSSKSDKYDAVPFISGQLELPLPEIRLLRKMSRAKRLDSVVQQERIIENDLSKNLILKCLATPGILLMQLDKEGCNTGQDTGA